MPVKKSTYVFVLLSLLSTMALGQQEHPPKKKPVYAPVWTYHQRGINIYGLSVGWMTFNEKPRFTNTHGIKLELVGAGLITALTPASPIAPDDSSYQAEKKHPRSEIINGLNLSALGTICDCTTNGILAGGFGHGTYKVNGIAIAPYINFTQTMNGFLFGMWNQTYYTRGLQIGIVHNEATKMRGIQIGIINKTTNLKGLQVGIWNISGKRKFPLINWGF